MSSLLPAGNVVWHPGLGAYTTYNVQVLPDDPDAQVAITIGSMARDAREDASSPEIQQAARDAMAESGSNDPLGAVWSYVRSRMSFVDDSITGAPVEDATGMPVVESVIRPSAMHDWYIGDCDDYVTYGASLLIALGVPVRFATVAADGRVPNQYSHVYLVAYPVADDGTVARVPMDLSHGKAIGWETENKFGKFKEWPVSGGAESSLSTIAIAAGMGLVIGLYGMRRAA